MLLHHEPKPPSGTNLGVARWFIGLGEISFRMISGYSVRSRHDALPPHADVRKPGNNNANIVRSCLLLGNNAVPRRPLCR
jgi:hypothetical protein